MEPSPAEFTFGRVPFKTSGQNAGLDYANPVQQPSRRVQVHVLDAATQTADLGTTSTDDLGNYSVSVTPNTNVVVQVEARMLS
jgi:hypothetical protein